MITRQRLNLFETIDRYQHDMDFEPHSDAMPTATAPGSLEKIQVMQGRLARGEELHHAGDVRMSARIELQAEMARHVGKNRIAGGDGKNCPEGCYRRSCRCSGATGSGRRD